MELGVDLITPRFRRFALKGSSLCIPTPTVLQPAQQVLSRAELHAFGQVESHVASRWIAAGLID